MKKYKTILSIEEIQEYIEHRYPFLLVDRVIGINKELKEITALKNVTVNEPFFVGHFEHLKIMPGVLILEALAQVAIISYYIDKDISPKNTKYRAIFSSISNAKFKKPVIPGDSLILKTQLTKERNNFLFCSGKAYVEDELVAEAILSAFLSEK